MGAVHPLHACMHPHACMQGMHACMEQPAEAGRPPPLLPEPLRCISPVLQGPPQHCLTVQGDAGGRLPPHPHPPLQNPNTNCLHLTSSSINATSLRVELWGGSAGRERPLLPGLRLTCLWGQSMTFAGCCGRCKTLCHRNPELPPSPRAAAAPSSPSACSRSPTAWCGDVGRLEPSALLFYPPTPGKSPRESLLTALQPSPLLLDVLESRTGNFPPAENVPLEEKTSTLGVAISRPREKHTTAAQSRCSVLHVRLLHNISFLRVHIRRRLICINGRT